MAEVKRRNRGEQQPNEILWLRNSLARYPPPKVATKRQQRKKVKRRGNEHISKPPYPPLRPKPGPGSRSNTPPSATRSPSNNLDPPPSITLDDAGAGDPAAPVAAHSSVSSSETTSSTNSRPPPGCSTSHHPAEPKQGLAARASSFGDHIMGNAAPSSLPTLPERLPPEGHQQTPQPVPAFEAQDVPTPASMADAWRSSTPEHNTSAVTTNDIREEQEAQRYQDHKAFIVKFKTSGGTTVNETAIFDPGSECGAVNPTTAEKLGFPIFPFKPGRSLGVTIACDAEESPEHGETRGVPTLGYAIRPLSRWIRRIPVEFDFATGQHYFNLMVRDRDLKFANVVFGKGAIAALKDLPGFKAGFPNLCGNILAVARNTNGVSALENTNGLSVSALENVAIAPSHDARQSEVCSQYIPPSTPFADSSTYPGDPPVSLSSSASTLHDPGIRYGHTLYSDLAPLVVPQHDFGSFQQDWSSQGFAQYNSDNSMAMDIPPLHTWDAALAHISTPTIHDPLTPVHYPYQYVHTYPNPDGHYSQPADAEPAWGRRPTPLSWQDLSMQGSNQHSI